MLNAQLSVTKWLLVLVQSLNFRYKCLVAVEGFKVALEEKSSKLPF